MFLTDVSIRRPVFIVMFILSLIVLGLNSRSRMSAELYPKVDIPYITVITVYPGAGPEEIETLVSQPIEENIGSVANVKHVWSSSQDGVSSVSLEFTIGTDLDTAAADVRDKLSVARGLLPKDVEEPVIYKADVSAMPVVTLTLSGPLSAKEMRILADDFVKDRISRVKGVAAVAVSGGQKREIQVRVDKDRLQAYGISINQVVGVVSGANMNLPSGSVKEGAREYTVRTVGEFTSAEQIRNLKISLPGDEEGSSPSVILLSDIAEVVDDVEEPTTFTRLNGKESVILSVQKQSDANTVEVAEGVKKQIKRISQALPPGVKLKIVDDQSVFVEDSLHDVNKSLFEGIALVVLIVFLFLHSGRATFIVALAIPTCIIATYLPMFAFGFTMNMMTMLALSLCVGILVDDSIVVIENIHRHLKMGESPRDAAYNGRSEIGLAAITITLVDVVVFVPIAFMGGVVGQFFRQFGITVAIATLFSLFVSFTLTPMLASRLFRPASEETGDNKGAFGRLFAAFDRFYSNLDVRYRGVLAWALENRFLTVIIGFVSLLVVFAFSMPQPKTPGPGWIPRIIVAFIALLLAAIAFKVNKSKGVALVFGVTMAFLALAVNLPFGFNFMPDVDRGEIGITIETPAGSSLEETDRYVRKIERILDRIPGMEFYQSSVGNAGSAFVGAGKQGPQYGYIYVKLVDKNDPRRQGNKVHDVVDIINRQTAMLPGADVRVSVIAGMGGDQQPIQMEVTGRNMNELNKVANALASRIRKVPGTKDVNLSWNVGKPELQVEVDRVRAAELQMSVAEIAAALRTSIAGNTDSKFREAGKEYDIRIRLERFDRKSAADVSRIIVGTRNGAPVYLRDVATVTVRPGPTQIDRKDRQRLITVSAGLKPGYSLGNVQEAINRKIADIQLGGASINAGGEAERMGESFGHMGQALNLSIILVYILMAMLFESVFSPFIIMFSLPQAMVGGLLALLITGNTLSIVSMIGVIMLMGLVTKNAILLVDYTNTLRSRGLGMYEAILEAGPTRLRPILMTTFAMVFGMLPTALAVSRGAEIRAPMAITVIGGLILSTLLTLIVIPVVYTIADDFVSGLKRRLIRSSAERSLTESTANGDNFADESIGSEENVVV